MAPYARSAPLPSALSSLSLLAVRLGCGGCLLYFHGIESATAAWHHIWSEDRSWALIAELDEAGFPFPAVLAIGATVILVSASTSLIVGFLTRLSAILASAVVAPALFVSLPSDHAIATEEVPVLYLLCLSVVIFQGGGRFGLDAVFQKKT